MDLALLQSGARICLGPQLGRGGEGTIFAVQGRHDQAAKRYATPPDARKVWKLVAMTRAANPALLSIAAWPSDLLADRKGRIWGFVMPRVTAKQDIHELYSPKSRSDSFPQADFAFLVTVATNVARAFGTLHQQGHIAGDVNYGNVLVGGDGTVMLIDCDSFQVTDRTEVFTCDVGVPLFTPPELQGRPFRGLKRTENHDRFGLAVLLFHLLYMGRHPYAGRYSGPGDMPIERAIGEFRFAYGPDRHENGMERPPGAIPLETFGAEIAQLFQSAFSRSGAIRGRPDDHSWVRVLGELGPALRPCPVADRHHYPGHLDACPWCAAEAQTGANLFGHKVSRSAGVVDLETLLQAIAGVPGPGPAPALPSERAWTPAPGFELPQKARRWRRRALAVGVACAGLIAGSEFGTPAAAASASVALGLAVASWPRIRRRERAAAEAICGTAKAVWDGLLNRWQREASSDDFEEKRKVLDRAGAELADFPNERSRRLLQLDAERETRQLERYLDRFRISGATVTGIGPGRTSMLASYGIETAADVDRKRIASIPGFDRMLTSELVRWRRNHEAGFRYNPNEPVDRRDVEAMDLELALRRQELLSMVREGPGALESLSLEIRAARARLMPLLEDAWTSLKMAEALRDAQ